MLALSFEEKNIIEIITQISSGISLLFLSLIIILFAYLKQIRSFATELILYLSISCIMFSVGFFLPKTIPLYCTIQGFIYISMDQSSLLWISFIGYTAYYSISRFQTFEKQLNLYRIMFFIIAYLLPLIYATV